MAKIILATDGQKLLKVETPKITSGDKNVDYLRVNCCPSWANFVKTAVFYRDENAAYKMILDDNNECLIPWEVLQSDGLLYMGIFGVENERVKTSEVISYKIDKGALFDNAKPSDPTPDIYEQILSEIQRIREISDDISAREQEFESRVNDSIASFNDTVSTATNTANNAANVANNAASVVGEAQAAANNAVNVAHTAQTTATEAKNALASCWISFTDEDGNPTEEPYIHWFQEV